MNRAVFIDVNERKIETKKMPKNILGPVDFGVYCHFSFKTYKLKPYDPLNVFCFGIGKLAGSKIPGTHRLVFVSKSPLWNGLRISSLGGAGLAFYKSGMEYAAILGKPKRDFLILLIRGSEKGMDSSFIRVSRRKLENLYFRYEGKSGTWALQEFTLKKAKNFFKKGDTVRIFSTGPASLLTNYGAICSTVLDSDLNLLEGQDDWVGRGGFGSLLVQSHGVVSLAIGGNLDWRKFDLKSFDKVNEIFKKFSKKDATQVWKDATKKYRYDENLGTGGTFGSNMAVADIWLPFFNWTSIELRRNIRKKIYEKFIRGKYLKQFNEEVIKTRSWKNCGEACLVVCKKIRGIKKIDYEPYEAIGPNCGIFDLDCAEDSVSLSDKYGFDAIEFGNIASWVLECYWKGLLRKKDLKTSIKVTFDPKYFLKEDNSLNHSLLVKRIGNLIISGHGIWKELRKGIKSGAEAFDKRFEKRTKKIGVKFVDLAVFNSNKFGSIAPIQYWVPGAFVPLPLIGKFFTYYQRDFLEPKKLGRKCAERFIEELKIENAGICRFHRKWAERIIEILVGKAVGRKIDLDKHTFRLIGKIIEYEKKSDSLPTFWESKKVKVIIKKYLEEMLIDFPKNEKIKRWVELFKKNFELASRKYWEEVVKGINEKLNLR